MLVVTCVALDQDAIDRIQEALSSAALKTWLKGLHLPIRESIGEQVRPGYAASCTVANWRNMDLWSTSAPCIMGGLVLALGSADAVIEAVTSGTYPKDCGAAEPVVPPVVPAPASPVDDPMIEAGRVIMKTLRIEAAIDEKVARMVAELAERSDALSREALALIAKQAREIDERVTKRLSEVEIIRHVFVTPKGTEWVPEAGEIVNPILPKIVRALTVGSATVKRQNVYMWGPRGSGKSFLAKQAAKALGLTFHPTDGFPEARASILIGKPRPVAGENGGTTMVFQTTEFLNGYENGGLTFIDEMDRFGPEVTVLLNGALENGYMLVPDRPEAPIAYQHPNHRFMGAGNTCLSGATQGYVTAERHDAATIDRLLGAMFYVDYDEMFERRLGPRDLVDEVHSLRRRVAEAGNAINRTIGTRFITKGVSILSEGLTLSETMDRLTADWSRAERERCGFKAHPWQKSSAR